jgi:hypothetical protein
MFVFNEVNLLVESTRGFRSVPAFGLLLLWLSSFSLHLKVEAWMGVTGKYGARGSFRPIKTNQKDSTACDFIPTIQ